MHKVLTRAYFKKHFFFVGIQNGEMVVAALLKHRDKPDIKLDRLYSSRGITLIKMGLKIFQILKKSRHRSIRSFAILSGKEFRQQND